jgi:hypothetical protein
VSVVLAAYAAERLASVGRRAELEPKLALDVGASCPVREPSTPVSAGRVVSDDGVDAGEAALAMRSSAAAVPDAGGTAKLPVEVEDKPPVSASPIDTAELVRAPSSTPS